MNIRQYLEAQRPEEVQQNKYEEECAHVHAGYLSAYDVCRLFAGQPHSAWSKTPGQTARALVEERALPLMEIGTGRWMVRHTLEGLQ
jgi:hypothetical protein